MMFYVINNINQGEALIDFRDIIEELNSIYGDFKGIKSDITTIAHVYTDYNNMAAPDGNVRLISNNPEIVFLGKYSPNTQHDGYLRHGELVEVELWAWRDPDYRE
jgi:hypothetical protein